jgi:hypothetical protein
LYPSASIAGFGALIRWRTTHSASMSSRGWFVFVEVSISRIVVDPDAETALDIHVIGGSVTCVRSRQAAAGHAAARRTLHMSVPGPSTRPAMRFVGIAFVRPQARSLLVGTDVPNHFIAVGHDCTPISRLSLNQIALQVVGCATAVPAIGVIPPPRIAGVT